MGSGTTAVAAENLGRDWLGVELNPVFADVARDRIATTRQDPHATPPERAAA
jgi:DNA modification methylase